MSEQTVFARGDFQAPCLVRRTGDHEVEVTLTAVRPDDVAALMRAMKTVCGSKVCELITATSTTRMMCLRVDGRELRRDLIAGGVEFVLGLRALPESKPAPPEWNTLKIGGVPAPAPVDSRYRYTTSTRPLPRLETPPAPVLRKCSGCGCYEGEPHVPTCPALAAGAVKRSRRTPEGPPDCACGRYVGEAHAPGCSVRAAEERRQREAPLVALVAAVPEGLDPIGWRAAAISTDEAFVRMPADVRPDPGGWGWRLERTIRGDRVLASEGTWMHAALSNGRDAYRRALTRQPPPMRPGRVLACNAYDVPGQP